MEIEATERPEVQRVLEAGKFGTDSARHMLGLSVGVASVLIGMVASAVVLASPHWALLPMLPAIALTKGWGAVRSARREHFSRRHWVDHRRAVATLLQYMTLPHAAGGVLWCLLTSGGLPLAIGGTAVVLITHRLVATATADHIYVLDYGHLPEHGTHTKLMARPDGLCQTTYQAQAAQYGLIPPPTGAFPSQRQDARPAPEEAR